MGFSYNAVWEDTLGLLRRNAPLLAAIAGVFLFLPALLFAVFLPPPVQQGGDPERAFRMWLEYYQSAAPWFFVQGLFTMVGNLAMLRLIFARDTVGGALVKGLTLLPFYFLLSLVSGFMFILAFILLIIPLLYLVGRLAPMSSAKVSDID